MAWFMIELLNELMNSLINQFAHELIHVGAVWIHRGPYLLKCHRSVLLYLFVGWGDAVN